MNRIVAVFLFVSSPFSLLQNQEDKMEEFNIITTAFKEGEGIPSKYTGEGEDVSPPFEWTGVPGGTKSFGLICLDPDAPPGTWVHWILYDLPGDSVSLEEGVLKTETLDNGARQGACWGVDSFSRVGYYGPFPPSGHGWHRYYFTLYALEVDSLGLAPKAEWKQVERAMEGHVLGKAGVMGKYKRD
ncbi:MAG: YbhB/YbcL family Raf kinase inhibitor-like protein [Candidatus Neomarinimicrobiota bacterium]